MTPDPAMRLARRDQRYVLFSADHRGRIFSGRVHHAPLSHRARHDRALEFPSGGGVRFFRSRRPPDGRARLADPLGGVKGGNLFGRGGHFVITL